MIMVIEGGGGGLTLFGLKSRSSIGTQAFVFVSFCAVVFKGFARKTTSVRPGQTELPTRVKVQDYVLRVSSQIVLRHRANFLDEQSYCPTPRTLVSYVSPNDNKTTWGELVGAAQIQLRSQALSSPGGPGDERTRERGWPK